LILADLWMLTSIFLFVFGCAFTLLLAKKSLREEYQQLRLQHHIHNNVQVSSSGEALFTTQKESHWLTREAVKLTSSLHGAGYLHPKALTYLLIIKLTFALLAFLLAYSFWGQDMSSDNSKLWLFAGMAFIANLIPDYYLEQVQKRNQAEISKALPDSLALLVICLESGATLERGLTMVSEQLVDVYPQLSKQWQVTLAQMKINPDKKVALMALADRNQLEEIKALVTVLIQAERFGSPLAQTLRNFSDEIRELRKLRLEENIAKLSAKITLPMLLLVFLPLLLILVAPQVTLLVDALKGMQ
jgi:tight adherence protein C